MSDFNNHNDNNSDNASPPSNHKKRKSPSPNSPLQPPAKRQRHNRTKVSKSFMCSMGNQPKPDRKSQPWTQQEKQRLIALKDAEKTNYDIAVELKRTKGGVIEQWKKICAQYREYQKQTPNTNNHIQNVSELEDDRDDHKEDECFQDIDNDGNESTSTVLTEDPSAVTNNASQIRYFQNLQRYMDFEQDNEYDAEYVEIDNIVMDLCTSKCGEVFRKYGCKITKYREMYDKYQMKHGIWKVINGRSVLCENQNRNENTDNRVRDIGIVGFDNSDVFEQYRNVERQKRDIDYIIENCETLQGSLDEAQSKEYMDIDKMIKNLKYFDGKYNIFTIKKDD